jgi:hypothetical protein
MVEDGGPERGDPSGQQRNRMQAARESASQAPAASRARARFAVGVMLSRVTVGGRGADNSHNVGGRP